MSAPTLPAPLHGELRRRDGFSYYLHRLIQLHGADVAERAAEHYLEHKQAFERFIVRATAPPEERMHR